VVRLKCRREIRSQMKRFYILYLLLCAMSCQAQVRECNKDVLVAKNEARIPSAVCIPNGYIIDEIYDSTDVDNDGLKEFIFSWRKRHLSDGDTIFVSIYNKTNAGYALLKTLNNLFPIHFEKYEMSYKIKDEKLASIFSQYNGLFPFRNLGIIGGEINIKIIAAVGEGYNVYYQFNVSQNNWALTRVEKWTEVGEKVTVAEFAIFDKRQVIDTFNYLDYMY
jgi:hypothetical protein